MSKDAKAKAAPGTTIESVWKVTQEYDGKYIAWTLHRRVATAKRPFFRKEKPAHVLLDGEGKWRAYIGQTMIGKCVKRSIEEPNGRSRVEDDNEVSQRARDMCDRWLSETEAEFGPVPTIEEPEEEPKEKPRWVSHNIKLREACKKGANHEEPCEW